MPYQLRDQHGASRAVAYLMMVAGPYNLITGVLMKIGAPIAELISLGVTAVALMLVGVLCWRRPQVLPKLFWPAVPLLSTAVVTGLNYGTRDASTGAQLFFLWPLLFGACFLGRRITTLTVVMISAGHALIAFSYLPMSGALNDWIAMTVAMAMTAWVVTSLNDRNDRLRRVLQQQATTDSLTGVANRRALDEALHEAVRDADAGAEPAALIVIDVDHFKKINDTRGHAAGDQALRAVADALRAAGDGLVARVGGDEFAVLLRTGPTEAFRYAETARAALTAVPAAPTLSIGVAVVPHHSAASADELQRVADAALYQAKEAGRGRTVIASAPARQNVDRIPEARATSAF
ncbi:histidine kinase [Actinoplanes sp. SE50]|uniref:GGDEF domain-containing protein n=1 Tax=unclassified Actinoplanes TaxID=2626549 RepID=UPI00023ECD15|nr:MULTISPECIES: GGDEF domain-containing protein [unclassified Actinoplanes]AEV86015.1 putative signaling protein [Actinoplanes sp. SE50/110]ATO84413.1 histidine kinase [Actinoplanes sp. SE50]SLM01823.1 histidine kinase [Actinoplanes sp. SE50/110]